MAPSTWEEIADLPLEIEAVERERRALQVSSGFERVSSVIRLVGGGQEGRGEDVTYKTEETDAALAAPPPPIAGRFTLRTYSQRLEEVQLFPDPPEQATTRDYRRWAYESAGLDLALRQQGVALHEVLGREAQPVTFVCSLRLGEPATIEPVRSRLAVHPWLRFKLDATPSWTDELLEQLAATGAVDVIDFKGQYEGTVVDDPGGRGQIADLYRRVAEAFPDAWLEDPALDDETGPVLEPHRDRITWDAPIHSIADVDALDFAPRMVNVKPSRFGALERLCAAYDELERRGIGAYGGGQYELDVGRDHIQLLAAIFHPHTPNDVAPLGFDVAHPDPGLASSPMAVTPASQGFAASITR